MTKYKYLQQLILLRLLSVAYGNLCGNNVQVRKSTLTEKLHLTPSPPGIAGPFKEYLFEVTEPTKFVTVKCWPLDNSNPVKDAKEYTVIVESQVNGKTDVSDLFCKGGSTPGIISSMGKIKVGLCSRNVKPLHLTAEPETGCNLDLRVTTEERTLDLSKNNNTCSVILTSLQGGIEATISAIKTKKTKTSRCKAAFIVATSTDEKNNGIERPILLDNKNKICKTAEESLKSEYTIETETSKAKIEYRNAAFVLKFKTKENLDISDRYTNTDTDGLDEDQVTDKEIRTTKTSNANTTSDGNFLEDYVPNEGSSNTPYIIALGCGGLLIIMVIIVALVLVKKRRVRSTSRKSKDGQFTRQNSTKYSHDLPAATMGVTRNPSIGSINNAMYDRVVSGQDTSGKSVNKKNKHEKLANNKNLTDSKKKRLAELEEQYGPLLETAEYHQNAFEIPESREMFRRETRPMLPPPQEATCRVASICERTLASPNLYESIAEMQPTLKPALQYDQTRASYITFTSDEFSDCEEASYDPVSQDSKFTPVVSYDTVDGASENAHLVKYHNVNELSSQPPKVTVYHTQDAIGSHKQLSSLPSEPSLLEPTNGYLDLNSQRSCSVASLLQEDKQHYLQPRPSCPDAIVACAYSSTEDLEQMRQRLLAVAHPSLLQNKDNTMSLIEIPSKTMYDSPRQSVEKIKSSDEVNKVSYATPRRPEHRL